MTFYNMQISLREQSLSDLIDDIRGLVKVAERVAALDCIAKYVDLALCRHGQSLYRLVADRPVEWIKLGYKIKSPIIFRESMIHLVGKYRSIDPQAFASLPDVVAELVAAKYNELEQQKITVEAKVWGHYPKILHPSESHKLQRKMRIDYAGNVFAWMGLCFFRQWLGQKMSHGFGMTASDGGYALYQLLYEGGNHYLTAEDLTRFAEFFPLSQKGFHLMINHLTLIKSEMKHFIRPLLVRNSLLKESVELNYLVCTELDNDEFPWVEKKISKKRTYHVESEDEGYQENEYENETDLPTAPSEEDRQGAHTSSSPEVDDNRRLVQKKRREK
jgi:hypothetical protein